MVVYKFGGASVNSPEGIRNMAQIVQAAQEELLVVVSAMGKTTNALEAVLEKMTKDDKRGALELFTSIEAYHDSLIEGVMGAGARMEEVEELYTQARDIIDHLTPPAEQDYDRTYDALVSYGELISTTIISLYLNHIGIENRWIDMRRCLITDSRFRAADVQLEVSTAKLRAEIAVSPFSIFIAQGFIGATPDGHTTTLGREGSDYSAALAANMLDASQVVIWKDVPGILNADPRLFDHTQLIPQLTYLDAIELAYSGAQIIHPKTIKPLQNKQIPLYVRPFADHTAKGSVIRGQMDGQIETPILILKPGQVLVSIRPEDFSFVLEERMLDILSTFDRYGVKVNLIQTSAVNLSLCVDQGRHLHEVIEELHGDFRVVYNSDMELLTIRGYTPELYALHAQAEDVFLSQRTRRIVRIVRKAKSR